MRAHDLMYHPFISKCWADAAQQNRAREQYERQQYGHVLGSPESQSRVRDPAYDRRPAPTRTGY